MASKTKAKSTVCGEGKKQSRNELRFAPNQINATTLNVLREIIGSE